jgi:Ca2+-binding RTX toxin-like protein
VDYWIPLGWGGSDADGADFSGSTSSTAYFNPGETSKTITFLANGDGAVEANEAFVVNLGNVRGAAMGTGSATGRIMNDDGVASSPLPPPPPPPPPPAASLFTLPTSAAPTNSIIGGSRGETLQGTSGADLLDGRRGADTLAGGAGDDTYVVGQPGDVVQENAGGGVDTVQSSVSSYALSANVENLKLTSTTAAQIGTGNELSYILTANDLGSTLNGAGGNDILIAGRGPDTLTGGIGKDLFQFDKVPGGAGHVTDFAIGQDVLDLRGLFVGAGYHGSNPLADGYISLQSDGAGGTSVWFDADGWAGSATAQRVTTLDHVAPNALQMQTDWVFN